MLLDLPPDVFKESVDMLDKAEILALISTSRLTRDMIYQYALNYIRTIHFGVAQSRSPNDSSDNNDDNNVILDAELLGRAQIALELVFHILSIENDQSNLLTTGCVEQVCFVKNGMKMFTRSQNGQIVIIWDLENRSFTQLDAISTLTQLDGSGHVVVAKKSSSNDNRSSMYDESPCHFTVWDQHGEMLLETPVDRGSLGCSYLRTLTVDTNATLTVYADASPVHPDARFEGQADEILVWNSETGRHEGNVGIYAPFTRWRSGHARRSDAMIAGGGWVLISWSETFNDYDDMHYRLTIFSRNSDLTLTHVETMSNSHHMETLVMSKDYSEVATSDAVGHVAIFTIDDDSGAYDKRFVLRNGPTKDEYDHFEDAYRFDVYVRSLLWENEKLYVGYNKRSSGSSGIEVWDVPEGSGRCSFAREIRLPDSWGNLNELATDGIFLYCALTNGGLKPLLL